MRPSRPRGRRPSVRWWRPAAKRTAVKDSSRGPCGAALRGAAALRRSLARSWRGRVSPATLSSARSAGIDLRPILKFVLTVNHDDITGIQAGAQAHVVTGSLRDGHDSNLDRVIGAGGVDISSLGTALNGRGGNDHEVMLCFHQKMDVDKLVRGERV